MTSPWRTRLTGGPNGPHKIAFWCISVAIAALAAYLSGLLPPPWNGNRRGSRKRTRQQRWESRAEAEQLLGRSRGRLAAERAEHAQLLIHSGFEGEAIDVLKSDATE